MVAQWISICLIMQWTWARSLIWEDPTYHGTTKPVYHNPEPLSRARAPQGEKLLQRSLPTAMKSSPACYNQRKPRQGTETQHGQKINFLYMYIFKEGPGAGLWLSSTGIFHHDLLPHIPSICLSAINNSPCPVIALQSLNSSSQPLRLLGY